MTISVYRRLTLRAGRRHFDTRPLIYHYAVVGADCRKRNRLPSDVLRFLSLASIISSVH